MADYNTVYSYAKAIDDGGLVHTQSYVKVSLPVLLTIPLGGWADCSMGGGVPRFNAYVAPQYEFTTMSGTANVGIYSGQDSAGKKYLTSVNMIGGTTATVPATFMLCDYLGFYPLLDCDSLDEQEMIVPSGVAIQRYTDGEGVRAFLVSTAPQSALGEMVIYYTNSAGVPDRVMRVYLQPVNYGQLNVNGAYLALADCRMPLIPLAPGDTGIRSIQKIQMVSAAGGFVCLVLVKPITHFVMAETQSSVEIDFLRQRQPIPQIENGAYLNFIASFGGLTPAAATIRGLLTFLRT